MSDDEERDEHEEHIKKHLAQAEASLKRTTEQIMGSMMEQMAPMLMGSQMVGDEAKAWDGYVCAVMRDTSLTTATVVNMADALLAERRRRFNKEAFAEQMRGMLPSGRGLCDKPILRNNGDDTGHRCTRNADHLPPCY
jgi:hypothetical protein